MRFLLALIGCLLAGLASAQISNNAVQWSTFLKGKDSKITSFSTRILNTEGEWQAFWQQLSGQPASSAPKGVDWGKELLVAVCSGTKKNGGYNVSIESIFAKNPSTYVIQFSEYEPGPGEMVPEYITSPYVVAKVKRVPGKLVFERVAAKTVGNWPKITPPLATGQFPCPLPWTWVQSGTVEMGLGQKTYCLASPEDFQRYAREILRDTKYLSLSNKINWNEEVLVAIHAGKVVPGSTVGVQSVLIDQFGGVLIQWYVKAPIGAPGDNQGEPWLLMRLPRYTTAPLCRQVSGR